MRNAQATRAKLLDTAMQLIGHSSYDQIGVNEICKQADVTKGAFYYHFRSKADLFNEAGQRHWQGFKPEFDRICSPSLTPLEQLDNLICMIIDRQTDTTPSEELELGECPIFTMDGMTGTDEDKVQQCSQKISSEVLKYYISLVRNLKNENLLNGDPDETQIARVIQQYIQGLLIYSRAYNDIKFVASDLREALFRILDLKQQYRSSDRKQT